MGWRSEKRPSESRVLGLCRLSLHLASALVPSESRREWREEWDVELACRREQMKSEGRWGAWASCLLVAESTGALADAFWHLSQEWSPDMLMQDLRYGARALARKPVFTLVAALTLALGIGATTAIFSIVDTVLLRPLPYPEPDRLVEIWEENPLKGWHKNIVAPANYLDWREQSTSFDDMAAILWSPAQRALSGAGEPQPVKAQLVTANLFDVLGVEPLYGRSFQPEDTWLGGEPSAVISHGLFERVFGGDPAALGRTILINQNPVTVVGVMPPGFSYPEKGIDAWGPTRWDPAAREQVWFRRAHFLRVVGRLAPGVTLAEAETELKTLALRLEQEYPETNTKMGVGVTPLHEWIVGDTRPALYLLLGAVAMVLLIACANVVNLLLVRSGARAKEMAVRTALGAARRRLVRQLLVENLMLSLVAGLLGVVLGRWGLQAFVAWGPESVPRLDEVVLDVRVLVTAAAVTLGATLLFGLWPAFAGSRLDVAVALHAAGRSSASERSQRRRRGLLVVSEVALALLLIMGAGLLVKSFYRLYQVDPGFDAERVLALELTLPSASYKKRPDLEAFLDELTERAAALPGVDEVGTSRFLPFLGDPWSSDFAVEGRDREAYGIEVRHYEVGAGFFPSLGIPLVAGRTFTSADRGSSVPAIVINETLARQYFPDQDPIGSRIAFDRYPDESSTWYDVIGVVGDVRIDSLRQEVRPMIYNSLAQRPSRRVFLTLRSGDDPRALAGTVRDLLRSIDDDLPFMRVTVLSEAIAESVARERFVTILLSAFALVALLLAAIGTYGVLAVAVHQRTREIGLRMALGATAGDVVRQVVREGMGLVSLGFVVGLGAALVLGRYLGSLLFEVEAWDLSTLAVVALVLLGAGLVASLLPARRASRIDPMTTLRCE